MVNITNISSIGSFYDLANYANAATGGLFWGIILVAIYIILLIKMSGNEGENIDRAFASASFSCLLLSLFLLQINFVNLLYPIVFALALAGSLFYIKFKAVR